MTLKHNAPEITYFTRQRWTGELHYSSVNGNAPTQSGEGANNPVFADHCGFDGFARAILKLRKELKVPHTLPDLIKGLKMDAKRRAEIAAMAVEDPSTGSNPVKLTKKAAQTLLENTIAGKL